MRVYTVPGTGGARVRPLECVVVFASTWGRVSRRTYQRLLRRRRAPLQTLCAFTDGSVAVYLGD